MASSNSPLDLLEVGQAQKEETANALFNAMSPSALFAYRELTSAGLVWAFYGGKFGSISLNNSSVTLNANTTNYIEAEKATGAVFVRTGSYSTDGAFVPLYRVRTNATGIQTGVFPSGGYVDDRPFPILESSYVLLPASTSVLGGVKIDGTTITINGSNVISATPYSLPTASTTTLGGVRVDGTTITITGGVISSTASAPPIATASTLGVVRVDGTTITIDAAGILTVIGGGGGGLVNFSDTKLTTAPNVSIPVSVLSAIDTIANVDIAIVPKGNGAFSLSLPDATASGGNKRGRNAVDLQTNRTAATQIASGSNAFIAGANNTASGNNAVAIGNSNSVASAGFAFGQNNTIQSGNNGVVAIGSSNTIYGNYAMVFGFANTITNAGNAMVVGWNNTVTTAGSYSIVIGNGNYSTEECYIFGRGGANKGIVGAIIFSNQTMGSGSVTSFAGKSQVGLYILRTITSATGAATSALTTGVGNATGSATNQIILQNNEYRTFFGYANIRTTDGSSRISFRIEGAVWRGANAASTVLDFVNVSTLNAFGDAVTNGYALNVIADTTLGGVRVEAISTAGPSIRSTCFIECVETQN